MLHRKNNTNSKSSGETPKQYRLFRAATLTILVLITLSGIVMEVFEKNYEGKVYPNVFIDGIAFGGKTKAEIAAYWESRNSPFATTQFELQFEDSVATLSGEDIGLGYDADLSALQAYLIGRSNGFLTNFYQKFIARQIHLTPYFRWKEQVIDDTLLDMADRIDIPMEDALFRFDNGKVTEFAPSKDGRRLDSQEAKKQMTDAFFRVANTNQQRLSIALPVVTVHPSVSTNNANSYGIKERIGRGYSEFFGSIPGRIHNVALAASRINGLLIKPGETFSFVDAVGDISAATGYQSAYIIKDGRTVLGDGGGVCQVSTTLFRAAMDAGLPIVERHAHAYRVHYYEEAGYKPGIDATVFSPSVDLKIKNDTPSYILIQARPDIKNLALTFELYGTRDGRTSQVFNEKMWDQAAPPAPLYQDDPTLPKGVVKQVDWAAWGAKTSFQYKVIRGADVLQDITFYSNFRPWQAVYLQGTL